MTKLKIIEIYYFTVQDLLLHMYNYVLTGLSKCLGSY